MSLPDEVFFLFFSFPILAYYANDKPFLVDTLFISHGSIEELQEHIFKCYLADFYIREKIEFERYKRNNSLRSKLISWFKKRILHE